MTYVSFHFASRNGKGTLEVIEMSRTEEDAFDVQCVEGGARSAPLVVNQQSRGAHVS